MRVKFKKIENYKKIETYTNNTFFNKIIVQFRIWSDLIIIWLFVQIVSSSNNLWRCEDLIGSEISRGLIILCVIVFFSNFGEIDNSIYDIFVNFTRTQRAQRVRICSATHVNYVQLSHGWQRCTWMTLHRISPRAAPSLGFNPGSLGVLPSCWTQLLVHGAHTQSGVANGTTASLSAAK